MNATGVQMSFTGFAGHRMVARGDLVEVALALQAEADRGAGERLVLIDDATGRSISLSLHGTAAQLRERLAALFPALQAEEEPPRRQGRGRPKLGVVSREVSLLPRHWEWLAGQPGGASAALRRLVEQARREGAAADRARASRDAAWHFMHELAGDLPGFEEASRALFAGDEARFRREIRSWPADVRAHARRLAEAAFQPVGGAAP